MQLPALQVRQPDVGNALYKATAIKGARTRNALVEHQMAREKEADDLAGAALTDMMGGAQGRQPGGNAMIAMAGTGGSAGTGPGGLPPSMRNFVAKFPDRAMKVINIWQKAGEEERAEIARTSERTARLAWAVIAAPEDRKPGAFAEALQIAQRQGLDVSHLPQAYSPQAEQALHMLVAQGMSIGDLAKLGEAKAPTVQEFFDDKSGQPYKAQWDSARRQWARVGGAKADTPTKPKLGEIRKFRQGTQEVSQEWTGTAWKEVGKGDAFSPGQGKQDPALIATARQFAMWKAGAEGREPEDADFVSAVEEINQAKTNPTAKAGLVVRAFDAMKSDNLDMRPEAEKRKAAKEFVDELMKESAPAARTPGSPRKPGQAGTAEEDAKVGKATKGPDGKAPPAPRDVAQRVLGRVYLAHDGRRVEWTVEGWRLVR